MKTNKPKRETEMLIPSKYISHTENISIKCKVYFIDLEGLCDGKSINNTII